MSYEDICRELVGGDGFEQATVDVLLRCERAAGRMEMRTGSAGGSEWRRVTVAGVGAMARERVGVA